MWNKTLITVTSIVLLLCVGPAPGEAAGPSPYEFHSLSTCTCPEVGPISEKDEIRLIQDQLHLCGYLPSSGNGSWNEETMQALKKFQLDKGLPPTGKIDLITRQALNYTAVRQIEQMSARPPADPLLLVVDTRRRTLTVIANNKLYKQYPVAVGKYETPSPIGSWRTTWRAVNWNSGFGSRWIGLNVPWGTYGIHGTNAPSSIGTYASHGCIRMYNRHVEEIFPWVKEGTGVLIVGNPFLYQKTSFRTLKYEDTGSDVLEIQNTLKRLGYFKGQPDGKFGIATLQAVKKVRADLGLTGPPVVDEPLYRALGY